MLLSSYFLISNFLTFFKTNTDHEKGNLEIYHSDFALYSHGYRYYAWRNLVYGLKILP